MDFTSVNKLMYGTKISTKEGLFLNKTNLHSVHAINLKKGENRKLVPKNSLEKEKYFFNVSRIASELLLKHSKKKAGTFLIRHSQKYRGKLTLSVFISENRGVTHYLIYQTCNGFYYIQPQNVFLTLEELIEFYSVPRCDFLQALTKPCSKHVQLSDNETIWFEKQSNVTLIGKIGTGKHGDVFKGLWKNNCHVSVKVIKHKIAAIETAFNEAELMKDLRHENILDIWCVCYDSFSIYIVSDYMINGSLLDFLDLNKGIMLTQDIIKIAGQIASALKYLESERYVHCALNLRNVLIGESNITKLTGFHYARKVSKKTNEADIPNDYVPPSKYNAPELKSTKRKYSTKCDVWFFGILLYELTNYGRMLDTCDNAKVNDGFQICILNETCSYSLYTIIRDCCSIDPNNRLNFSQLKKIFNNYFQYEQSNQRFKTSAHVDLMNLIQRKFQQTKQSFN